jgi:hypothetical protein
MPINLLGPQTIEENRETLVTVIHATRIDSRAVAYPGKGLFLCNASIFRFK